MSNQQPSNNIVNFKSVSWSDKMICLTNKLGDQVINRKHSLLKAKMTVDEAVLLGDADCISAARDLYYIVLKGYIGALDTYIKALKLQG